MDRTKKDNEMKSMKKDGSDLLMYVGLGFVENEEPLVTSEL